jgi:hypothetical protein
MCSFFSCFVGLVPGGPGMIGIYCFIIKKTNARTNAAQAEIRAIWLLGHWRAARLMAAVAGRAGNKLIKRTAMTDASGSAQRLFGIPAIMLARLSAAAAFGSVASRPASVQGSAPKRAKTDITLSVMPFASVPISANRNWFKSDR